MSGLSFQETVFRLKKYWSDRGAIIQEPYDVEVGAGTMAPETFLRVLGPDPYRVAYVQPSRRPADGRYGENPNRLYKHQQLQVILKPSPADVIDQYLGSLKAIGIDLAKHDIKFEEDNWEGSDAPRRYEYVLTECGRDLWKVLLTIWSWQAVWVTEHNKPMPPMYHTECGEELSPVMYCRACGQPAGIRDVRAARPASVSCTARRSRSAATRPRPVSSRRQYGPSASGLPGPSPGSSR